jgi:DnaK suppressor protein
MALTTQQLEHYRRILSERRDELARGTARAESEVNDQVDLERLDPVDRATASNAKDELLREAGQDSEQLQRIEVALRAIDNGTYGVCAVCGREIPVSRLNALPWATLCIEDQQRAEKRQKDLSDGTQGGAPSRVVL